MKTNIKKELHTKSVIELRKQLLEAGLELATLKMNHEQAKVKDTSSLSKKRSEIAVVKTIINEKLVAERLASTEKLDDKKKVVAEEKTITKKAKLAAVKTKADKGGKNE